MDVNAMLQGLDGFDLAVLTLNTCAHWQLKDAIEGDSNTVRCERVNSNTLLIRRVRLSTMAQLTEVVETALQRCLTRALGDRLNPVQRVRRDVPTQFYQLAS